jgi:hypothetical protein
MADLPTPNTPAQLQRQLAAAEEKRRQANAEWEEARREAITQSVKDAIAFFNAINWEAPGQHFRGNRVITNEQGKCLRFNAALEVPLVGFRAVGEDTYWLDTATLLFQLLAQAFAAGGWKLQSVYRKHGGEFDVTCVAIDH